MNELTMDGLTVEREDGKATVYLGDTPVAEINEAELMARGYLVGEWYDVYSGELVSAGVKVPCIKVEITARSELD